MLVLDPPVCVYCRSGVEISSDQYGAKTRTQDRAEALDEIFDHLDATGHRGIRSRVEGSRIIKRCEECALEAERKAE